MGRSTGIDSRTERGAIDAGHRQGGGRDARNREHTILELLPRDLSYAQIGTRLDLSVNTVKMNLKSIYRKLAVTSRSEAVDAARSAGLP
jgi:LuxR family maltose regulon positive regulatory protein